jgi:hypothetical protein
VSCRQSTPLSYRCTGQKHFVNSRLQLRQSITSSGVRKAAGFPSPGGTLTANAKRCTLRTSRRVNIIRDMPLSDDGIDGSIVLITDSPIDMTSLSGIESRINDSVMRFHLSRCVAQWEEVTAF